MSRPLADYSGVPQRPGVCLYQLTCEKRSGECQSYPQAVAGSVALLPSGIYYSLQCNSCCNGGELSLRLLQALSFRVRLRRPV
jgi:hypothetical protein